MSGEDEAGCCADALSDAFLEARERDLRERLGRRRYEHTLGVAAARRARAYGVDERKARLAGLLHDWDKGYDDAGIRARVEELGLAVDPYVFEEMPWLLHGPTAAAALARAFPCLLRDVVQAIARQSGDKAAREAADRLDTRRDMRDRMAHSLSFGLLMTCLGLCVILTVVICHVF